MTFVVLHAAIFTRRTRKISTTAELISPPAALNCVSAAHGLMVMQCAPSSSAAASRA
jgi:hypothetical protein